MPAAAMQAARCSSTRPFTRSACAPRGPVSIRAQQPCEQAQQAQHQQAQQAPPLSRRAGLLLGGAAAAAGLLDACPAARAGPLEDVARQLTRPEITPLEATVALLDARSTLREMVSLVASAPDSADRFNGRKLWPAYAKWLRPVGPSAPVAAAIIAGTDTEATLSADYGGSGSTASPVDGLYAAFGRVLTISGRTIRDEAQVEPQLIKDAEAAVEQVLSKLPAELVQQAQDLRVARAAAGKA